MRRSWEKPRERRYWDAHGKPPIVCGETVEVPASVILYYLMTGGGKTESPPIPILLYFDEAVDPLCKDYVKGVEGDVLVFPNANIRDSCLLVDRVIFFTVDSDELVLDKEFEFLMQRRRDSAGGVNPGPPEQKAKGVGDIEGLEDGANVESGAVVDHDPTDYVVVALANNVQCPRMPVTLGGKLILDEGNLIGEDGVYSLLNPILGRSPSGLVRARSEMWADNYNFRRDIFDNKWDRGFLYVLLPNGAYTDNVEWWVLSSTHDQEGGGSVAKSTLMELTVDALVLHCWVKVGTERLRPNLAACEKLPIYVGRSSRQGCKVLALAWLGGTALPNLLSWSPLRRLRRSQSRGSALLGLSRGVLLRGWRLNNSRQRRVLGLLDLVGLLLDAYIELFPGLDQLGKRGGVRQKVKVIHTLERRMKQLDLLFLTNQRVVLRCLSSPLRCVCLEVRAGAWELVIGETIGCGIVETGGGTGMDSDGGACIADSTDRKATCSRGTAIGAGGRGSLTGWIAGACVIAGAGASSLSEAKVGGTPGTAIRADSLVLDDDARAASGGACSKDAPESAGSSPENVSGGKCIDGAPKYAIGTLAGVGGGGGARVVGG
ncbi:hypothetical protein CRG98_007514 [Punica granatum]|uniref:Uncharacterized protein n=2 Tax=Punica granatum TaxID=22663 RepID=A0A2I0KUG9_PUNGR|nr:hypothetical protein CRG98_007514 [Punica granatum]